MPTVQACLFVFLTINVLDLHRAEDGNLSAAAYGCWSRLHACSISVVHSLGMSVWYSCRLMGLEASMRNTSCTLSQQELVPCR